MRLFVAVLLPSDARKSLSRIQNTLRRLVGGSGIAWVAEDNFHITMKFLGDQPPDSVPTVSAALEAAVQGYAPFEIHLEGLGAFPRIERPSALWVGVREGAESLNQLQSSLEESLQNVGLPTDDRPFHGHVTIGRVKRAATGLRAAFEACGAAEIAEVRVDAIALMESELRSDGAHYTEVARMPLKG